MKFELFVLLAEVNHVAPFTGAWIEIHLEQRTRSNERVAPFTGAWIEIMPILYEPKTAQCRSLHGSVD